MDWVNKNPADGMLCIWLGPLYPFVLVYKPNLAEVCELNERFLSEYY